MLEAGKSRVVFEPGEQGVDSFTAAGDSAVNAFAREQQRALDAVLVHQVQQRLLQRFRVIKRDKMIQSHDHNF